MTVVVVVVIVVVEVVVVAAVVHSDIGLVTAVALAAGMVCKGYLLYHIGMRSAFRTGDGHLWKEPQILAERTGIHVSGTDPMLCSPGHRHHQPRSFLNTQKPL